VIVFESLVVSIREERIEGRREAVECPITNCLITIHRNRYLLLHHQLRYEAGSVSHVRFTHASAQILECNLRCTILQLSGRDDRP